MAIAKKPEQSPNAIAQAGDEKAAEAFIRGAHRTAPAGEKLKKKPVILRFDDAMLDEIDRRADSMGLGRAAWVRMTVAKALQDEQ